VDVWLDDYAGIYYAAVGERHPFTEVERTSLEARRQLRGQLQCQPFSWFLDTVVPQLVAPDNASVHFGQIKNLYTKSCLQVNQTRSDDFLEMTSCAWHDVTSTFSFNVNSTIVKHGCGRCLTALDTGYATLERCQTGWVSQRWTFRATDQDWMRYRSTDIDHKDYRELDSRPSSVAKLSATTDKGRVVCLTQVSVFTSLGREQIGGLLDCVSTGHVSHLFQYWYYTYTLRWDT